MYLNKNPWTATAAISPVYLQLWIGHVETLAVLLSYYLFTSTGLNWSYVSEQAQHLNKVGT